jgi:hypothetical protein
MIIITLMIVIILISVFSITFEYITSGKFTPQNITVIILAITVIFQQLTIDLNNN